MRIPAHIAPTAYPSSRPSRLRLPFLSILHAKFCRVCWASSRKVDASAWPFSACLGVPADDLNFTQRPTAHDPPSSNVRHPPSSRPPRPAPHLPAFTITSITLKVAIKSVNHVGLLLGRRHELAGPLFELPPLQTPISRSRDQQPTHPKPPSTSSHNLTHGHSEALSRHPQPLIDILTPVDGHRQHHSDSLLAVRHCLPGASPSHPILLDATIQLDPSQEEPSFPSPWVTLRLRNRDPATPVPDIGPPSRPPSIPLPRLHATTVLGVGIARVATILAPCSALANRPRTPAANPPTSVARPRPNARLGDWSAKR